MGYIEQERCIRFCDDLCRLLEDEKSAVSDFMEGDICEEYKKLLDLEIGELVRLRRIMAESF